MNKYLKNFLKITLSLALGIFIFWWAYRGMDFKEILSILKRNIRYEYILIGMLIGILANVFRAVRWKMLIDALDEQKPTLTNTFFSVLVGYFVNFLIPRAGEVVRCGIISQYHKIPVTKTVGTMISERAIDAISIVIILLVAFLLQIGLFKSFVSEHIVFSPSNFLFWIAGILLVVLLLFWILKKRIGNNILYRKVVIMLKDIVVGIKTSLRLKHKYWFLFHSAAIWICYFLMLYIPIFAFDFTEHLSVFAIVFVFAMSNLSTFVPVQGGIGAWHTMVILSLALFGIGEVEAGTFALVVHGSQLLFYMVSGLISLVGLQVVNKEKV